MTDSPSRLAKLQSAPHHVKRRWAVGISAVLILVVFAAWASYVRNLVRQPGVETTRAEGVTFAESVRGGTAAILHAAASTFAGIGAGLSGPREYEIKPEK